MLLSLPSGLPAPLDIEKKYSRGGEYSGEGELYETDVALQKQNYSEQI